MTVRRAPGVSGVAGLSRRSLRLWWGEFGSLLLLNIAWFLFQLPVVTAPIATAVVYALARRVVDDEVIGLRDARRALRSVAFPALLWGGLNLAVATVVIGNFWAYQSEAGLLWALVRVTWGVVGLGWLIVNLFYWPFWLAARKPRLGTTLRNSALFVVRRPARGFGVGILCVLTFAGALLLTLPLAAAAMTWVALLTLLAVDAELEAVGGSAEMAGAGAK